MDFKVAIGFDEEAGVFCVTDTEIAGLWLEAPTRDALVEKIRDAAPDLVAHNHSHRGAFHIELSEHMALTDAA